MGDKPTVQQRRRRSVKLFQKCGNLVKIDVLENALYGPSLHCFLLSVAMLIGKGMEDFFKHNSVSILKNQGFRTNGSQNGSLYLLDTIAPLSVMREAALIADVDTWYARIEHHHLKFIRPMAKKKTWSAERHSQKNQARNNASLVHLKSSLNRQLRPLPTKVSVRSLKELIVMCIDLSSSLEKVGHNILLHLLMKPLVRFKSIRLVKSPRF